MSVESESNYRMLQEEKRGKTHSQNNPEAGEGVGVDVFVVARKYTRYGIPLIFGNPSPNAIAFRAHYNIINKIIDLSVMA